MWTINLQKKYFKIDNMFYYESHLSYDIYVEHFFFYQI